MGSGQLNTQVKVKVVQSCPTFCDSVDYTVHGILQARILESVAFPISKGSSQPRVLTQVTHIAGGFFTIWATRGALSSIRVFSNELACPIKWPKYWSFNLSISPSNEYSELISFRIDWFDLLAVQVEGGLPSYLLKSSFSQKRQGWGVFNTDFHLLPFSASSLVSLVHTQLV